MKDQLEKNVKSDENLEQLYQSLKGMKIDFIPSQGNFVCMKTKKGGSNIFNSLLKEGVIVRSLDLYAMPQHIRITIGSEEENKFFIEKLHKVISS